MNLNGENSLTFSSTSRQVFVFVERPAKVLHFTKEFLDKHDLPQKHKGLDKKGLGFVLNFVKEKDNPIGAFCFYLYDVDGIQEPIIITDFSKDKETVLGFLNIPRQMFGVFERHILILNGFFSSDYVKEQTEIWTSSLPKIEI